MDTLTSMELFVKAVESGSFSATARSMNLTPSAVSKQISRLEDRLGARLFNRTTRQLAATGEGRAYYERCQQILADIQEAEAAVTELNTEPRGALRVNMPVVFGRRHIVPILGEFLERYPYVSMELSMSDQFVDPIAEGADMLIRVGELKDSSLITRKLAEARRVVAATPAYWKKNGTPQKPEELRAHNCLTYSYLSSGNTWRMTDLKGKEHVIQAKGNLASNNGEALLEAAAEGLGVVNLPTWMVGPDLESGRLTEVLADYAQPEPSVHVIYPPGRHLSAKVRAFVDFLAGHFKERPLGTATK
jgi:DNA-binding transcriptional LysR family regulator